MSNSLGMDGTQNIAGDFLAQYHGEEARIRRQLQLLKDDRERLYKEITAQEAQEAQDEGLMRHHDEVVQYITALEKEIQEKFGARGGRRKKHRRTKRHSKSRRSKSRRSKSRRSKH